MDRFGIGYTERKEKEISLGSKSRVLVPWPPPIRELFSSSALERLAPLGIMAAQLKALLQSSGTILLCCLRSNIVVLFGGFRDAPVSRMAVRLILFIIIFL